MSRKWAVVLVSLIVVLFGLFGLMGYYMSKDLHRNDADPTPELTTYLGVTYGNCRKAVLAEIRPGKPNKTVFTDDWRVIRCPALPGVKEPRPDVTPHIHLNGLDYKSFTAEYAGMTAPRPTEPPVDLLFIALPR